YFGEFKMWAGGMFIKEPRSSQLNEAKANPPKCKEGIGGPGQSHEKFTGDYRVCSVVQDKGVANNLFQMETHFFMEEKSCRCPWVSTRWFVSKAWWIREWIGIDDINWWTFC